MAQLGSDPETRFFGDHGRYPGHGLPDPGFHACERFAGGLAGSQVAQMKKTAFYRFLKQPGSYRILAGGAIVILLAMATLTGGLWTEYGPDDLDLEHQLAPPSVEWLKNLLTTDEGLRIQERNRSGGRSGQPARFSEAEDDGLDFLGPAATEEGSAAERPASEGSAHYLGTDRNGRDMLALLIAGARNCFLPGLVTCAMALGLGVPLGLLSGYYRGRIRAVVGTFSGVILFSPRLVLILVVISAVEPNVYYTMAVLGATLIPRVSELISTRVRILSNMGFIMAAKEAALSDFKILYRHLFWYQNRAVFSIQFSLIMAESILVETT